MLRKLCVGMNYRRKLILSFFHTHSQNSKTFAQTINLKNNKYLTILMKLNIAVCQFKIKEHNPKKNIERAEQFIKKASGKADIIVFPEYFINDSCKNNKFVDRKRKFVKHFQHLAKKYNIDIVPGSIIEEEKKKNKSKIFNATYYIDSNGKIKAEYKKVNLWYSERRHVKPGRNICVIDTKFGKIGLIICWDLEFPEVFRKMDRQNVKIVICTSYWCFGDAGKGLKYDHNSEIKMVDSLCVDRAFENEIILVYCNSAGNKQIGSIGHSQITEPFKGVIKKFNHNREGMFIQKINTEILKDAESVYKIRRELKKKK